MNHFKTLMIKVISLPVTKAKTASWC